MKAIVIVLDSVGCGEMPDAGRFGDFGVNTLKHTAEAVGGLSLPNMQKMGLGNITDIKGVPPNPTPIACWGKMMERGPAKDTTAGHWEMMGVIVRKAFPTFPKGFPKEVIDKFKELTGFDVIGNKVASGTEIIKELGEEHMRTGALIVYTSADSVFQIAAHEEVVPLDKLYEVCRIAREKVLVGPYAVGRVIARPFVGSNAENFKRTANRRDFSLKPPEPTLLDIMKDAGYEVAAVGKIEDIFAGQGITRAVHTKDNMDTVDKTIAYMKEEWDGMVFANLVDFDMVYGHRRNPVGYANALEAFDGRLPEIFANMQKDDVLFITADHGNDPTYERSTDHTREYVPLLVYRKGCVSSYLGLRMTFADLGQTVADMFKVGPLKNGISFFDKIKGEV